MGKSLSLIHYVLENSSLSCWAPISPKRREGLLLPFHVLRHHLFLIPRDVVSGA